MNLEKYTKIVDRIEHIYYPAKNPKCLFITFACIGTNYNRVSQFWHNESWNEISYLFLRDSGKWYSNYDKVVDFYASQFQNIVTIGSSLGSFGALWHGCRIDAKAIIVTAPALPWHDSNLIEQFKQNLSNLPPLYIECTNVMPDYKIFSEIINHYVSKGGKIICELNLNHPFHDLLSIADAKHVYRTAKYLLNWNGVELNINDVNI